MAQRKSVKVLVVMTAGDEKKEAQVARYIAQIITNSGIFEVLQLAVAHTKKDIADSVERNSFEYIIIQEKLGNDQVGIGSLKQWERANPNVRLILLVSPDKTGGKKLRSCYDKEYYDAIIASDLDVNGGSVLTSVMERGRTAEEARVYYGIGEIEAAPDGGQTAEKAAEDINHSMPVKNDSSNISANADINQGFPLENIFDFPLNYSGQGSREQSIKDNVLSFDQKNEGAAPFMEQAGQMAGSGDVRGAVMENSKEQNYRQDNVEPFTNGEPIKQDNHFPQEAYKGQQDWNGGGNGIYGNQIVGESEETGDMKMDTDDYNRESTVQGNMPGNDYGRQILPEEYYDNDSIGGRNYPDGSMGDMMQGEGQGLGKPYEPHFVGGAHLSAPSTVVRRDLMVNPTVRSYDGYVVRVITDTVVLVEVPGAKFLDDINVADGARIDLITGTL